MHFLVLVKHSQPLIDPSIPAKYWNLSQTGKERCIALAREIAPLEPEMIYTSKEPKAQDTGKILADQFGIGWSTVENLHEHERENAGFKSNEKFQEDIRELFSKPDMVVMGSESADQACERFEKAINQITMTVNERSMAIVAHGTVISLVVSRWTGMDAHSLWKKLGLPSAVVLAMPGYKIHKIIESVE